MSNHNLTKLAQRQKTSMKAEVRFLPIDERRYPVAPKGEKGCTQEADGTPERRDNAHHTLTSAPLAPGKSSAIFCRLMPRVRFILREWILRMSRRACISVCVCTVSVQGVSNRGLFAQERVSGSVRNRGSHRTPYNQRTRSPYEHAADVPYLPKCCPRKGARKNSTRSLPSRTLSPACITLA